MWTAGRPLLSFPRHRSTSATVHGYPRSWSKPRPTLRLSSGQACLTCWRWAAGWMGRGWTRMDTDLTDLLSAFVRVNPCPKCGLLLLSETWRLKSQSRKSGCEHRCPALHKCRAPYRLKPVGPPSKPRTVQPPACFRRPRPPTNPRIAPPSFVYSCRYSWTAPPQCPPSTNPHYWLALASSSSITRWISSKDSG